MVTLPRELSVMELFPAMDESAWRELAERDLRGAPFEKKLVTHTYEGLRLQPVYTPESAAAPAAAHSGDHPGTRGNHPLGVSQCGWDVRQERTEAGLEALNKAILDDLEHGVTSVLLRLDVGGRNGLDPTDPRAARLVGVDGVPIATVGDLRVAFDGVHLQMIGVALEAGAAFLPAASLVMAMWDEAGVDVGAARGAFNADPLGVLARDGQLPMSLESAYDQMAALAGYAAGTYRNVTSVRVGSAPYHHAGATAAQDLAFSIATGLEYLRALTERGVGLDQAAKQLLFNYGVGCHFFLAGAKLRAARELWARVVNACGGSDEAGHMRMHVRTSKRVLTARDPWVNLLRNTSCLFAAAVGGAEVVSSSPFDQAAGQGSARGRRIARNTATILQEEAHLLRVCDPAGGSWYIERLTAELVEKAWVIVQAIEARGGMAAALLDGWVADQLRSSTQVRSKNLATRRDAVVGVSEFPNPGEAAVGGEVVSRASVVGAARARMLSRGGDASARSSALERLVGLDGVVGHAIGAARAGASLGEISSRVFDGGAATIGAPIAPHPYSEAFERLRDASDAFSELTGSRPRVYLASVGSPAEFSARASFSTGFFEAGGFEVVAGGGGGDASEIARGFAASGSGIAVICSTDERYAAVVSELAPELHRAGARTVVLAGNPGDHEGAFRAAGVDRFIFVKCDVVEVLTQLLGEEGVLA